MNPGDEITVTIEKMISGGIGLAKINNTAVFIKNTLPEEIVKIKITKINKSYIEGEIISVEKPSIYRIKPNCAFSKICGSCDLSYVEYNEQLNQKKLVIKETIKKIAGIDIDVQNIIASPKIKEYRCKIQLPYTQTKVSKRLLSGYYKKNSHELINIKHCSMHPDIINEINEYLKEKAQNLNITGYNEKYNTGLIRHVIYRISSDLKQILVIFVINSNKIEQNLKTLSLLLRQKYPQIVGICANFNTKNTNVITGERTEIISGQDFYTEVLGNKKYKISSSSFFQVNPYCAELIFEKVKDLISKRVEKPSILDAYSGVSSFGIWLSDIAKDVTCIEEVKSASQDAINNLKLNNISNLKIINGDAAKEFEKLIKKGVEFDISVTDPPRKGCSLESINYLAKLTSKYIIYVSCNPATLARDIKLLKEHYFELEYLQGADMFPNTCHIECIAVLKKF